jgi:subtilisin-like proprotein convertase family protein
MLRNRIGRARVLRLAAVGALALAAQLCLASGASANTFPASHMTLGPILGDASDPLVVEFPVSGLPADPPTQVAVTLTMDHTWAGDLSADLVAPDGTTRTTLFARPNGNLESSNFDCTYTFSDRAPVTPTLPGALGLLDDDGVLPSESYRASDLAGTVHPITSAFAGIASPNGTWTLEVSDAFLPADSGSVTAANLELSGSVAATPDSLGQIPDGTAPGTYNVHRDITFSVSGLPLGAPADVSISMTANHSWMGNVDAKLVDPANTETTIFSRTGAGNSTAPGSFSNLNGTYRFFDGAQTATSWWGAAAAAAGGDIPSGSYRASLPGGGDPSGGDPTLLTPAFSGLADPNGIWALRVRDSTPGDVGSITGASLRLVGAADATAPAAPGLLQTVPSTGSSSSSPKVRGNAETGSMVRLYPNGTCTGLARVVGTAADLSGAGITFPVDSNSETTISAAAYDTSGNISACATGSTLTYREDSIAPTTPVLTGTNPPSPADDDSPMVLGTTEDVSFDNDVEVDIYKSADCSGASVSPSGTETLLEGPGIVIAVGDDSTTIVSARATDPGGNPSGCSAPLTYVEDSTGVAPTLTGTSPASPSNVAAPRVRGSAEAGSNVNVYASNDCSGLSAATGTAAELAGAGIEIDADANTTMGISAKITDAAANESGCSAPISYTHDSIAPAPATLSATDPPSGSDENAPRIQGSAEAGSAVRLFATSGCSGSALVAGTAAELASPGLAVSVADDSTTEFRALATDQAGNVSSCSSPISYSEVTPVPTPPAPPDVPEPPAAIDLTPPQTQIDSAPKATLKTKAKSAPYSIVFSADETATFKCSLDGAAPTSCTSPATGEAKKGPHTFSVTATDAAGNPDPTPPTATWTVKRKKKHGHH